MSVDLLQTKIAADDISIFSSPGQSPERAIILPPVSAAAARDFFSIFGKGPKGPLVWEFYRCLTTNWENSQMKIFQIFYKVCLELHAVM